MISSLTCRDSKIEIVAVKRNPPELHNILRKLYEKSSQGNVTVREIFPDAEGSQKLIQSATVDIDFDATIGDAAEYAIYVSQTLQDAPVVFDFNDVSLTVRSSDEPNKVIEKYLAERNHGRLAQAS